MNRKFLLNNLIFVGLLSLLLIPAVILKNTFVVPWSVTAVLVLMVQLVSEPKLKKICGYVASAAFLFAIGHSIVFIAGRFANP
jgi:hypothetical protein